MQRTKLHRLYFPLALMASLLGWVGAEQIIPYEEGIVHLLDGEMCFMPNDGRIGPSLTSDDWGFSPLKSFYCNQQIIALDDKKLSYREGVSLHPAQRPDLQQIDFLDYAEPYYIAVGGGQMALSSNLIDWTLWSLPTTSPIVGLATMGNSAILLSQDGVMIYTLDGKEWLRMDYNSYYNQDITFAGIKSRGDLYYAYGQNKRSGGPIITLSRDRKSWSSREPSLSNNQTQAPANNELILNDAQWAGEEFLLLCNDGWLITLPQCVKCDTLRREGSEDWMQALFIKGQIHLLSSEGSLYSYSIP